jgi:uncharacterized protein (DUF1499 family)
MLTIITILTLVVGSGYVYDQNTQVPTLGVENGQLKALSSKPNNVSTQAKSEEKRIPVLPAKETPEATIAALKTAIDQYGHARIVKETQDYLYVVFTTSVVRFHDDAEFWIDIKNNQVHFRSASRVGYSDMGLNRKRYEALSEYYLAN